MGKLRLLPSQGRKACSNSEETMHGMERESQQTALTPAHNNAGNQLLLPAAWNPPGEKPLFNLELGPFPPTIPFPPTRSFPFPLSSDLSSGYRMQLRHSSEKKGKELGEADGALPGEVRLELVVSSQTSYRQMAVFSLGTEPRLQRQADPDSSPSICH